MFSKKRRTASGRSVYVEERADMEEEPTQGHAFPETAKTIS